MVQEISLKDVIETCPVVTTDRRWPCNREEKGSEPYFTIFPECRNDPKRSDFGCVTDLPSPSAKGGGFFPVLLLLNDVQWNRWEKSTAGGVSERQHSGNWRLVNGRRNKASSGSMDIDHPEWETCCLAYRYYQDAFERTRNNLTVGAM